MFALRQHHNFESAPLILAQESLIVSNSFLAITRPNLASHDNEPNVSRNTEASIAIKQYFWKKAFRFLQRSMIADVIGANRTAEVRIPCSWEVIDVCSDTSDDNSRAHRIRKLSCIKAAEIFTKIISLTSAVAL